MDGVITGGYLTDAITADPGDAIEGTITGRTFRTAFTALTAVYATLVAITDPVIAARGDADIAAPIIVDVVSIIALFIAVYRTIATPCNATSIGALIAIIGIAVIALFTIFGIDDGVTTKADCPRRQPAIVTAQGAGDLAIGTITTIVCALVARLSVLNYAIAAGWSTSAVRPVGPITANALTISGADGPIELKTEYGASIFGRTIMAGGRNPGHLMVE